MSHNDLDDSRTFSVTKKVNRPGITGGSYL